MMKKLIAMLLALLICVSFCACGEEAGAGQTQGTGNVAKPAPETTAPFGADGENPTEDTQNEEAPKNPVIPMSDDLLDFTIRIDGTVYQFPCSASVFLNDGWQLAMDWLLDEDHVVEPGSTANTDIYRTNSSESVFLLVYNPGKSACKFEECVVSGVYLPNSSNLDVEFANGIKLGDSITVEDFLATNSDFRDKGYGVVTYASKGNRYYFEFKDNTLVYVMVETKQDK